MMLPPDRKQLFDEVLDLISWVFPTSRPVIGGGALRDTLLGAPIKDIDVFVSTQHVGQALPASIMVKRVHCSPQTALYGRHDMHGAWDFVQSVQGYPVQVILCDFVDLYDLALSFDIGLSRVTYDKKHGLYVSKDFAQDAEDKKFRIRRADNPYELERSLKRVQKQLEKYPEYSLDPEYCGYITRARRDVPLTAAACVACGAKVSPSTFRNSISLREYDISGLCQSCQDSVFGPD